MSRVTTLGPVGYNPTGNYDSTRQYEKLDVVYYEGSSYVAISDSIGQLPTNSEYWNCIAVGALKSFTYDSVADMKADDTLENGMFVGTAGYYSLNDGGGACYKIRTKTNEDIIDDGSIIAISETLVAELISNGVIYSKQYGAKGDNETDDFTALTKFFTKEAKKYIVNNGTYCISDDLQIVNSNCTIEFQNASIKYLPNEKTGYRVFNLNQVENIVLNKIHLIGDKDQHLGENGEWGHCLHIVESSNILVKDSTFENAWGDGIYIGLNYYITPTHLVENITVDNCVIDNVSRNGISTCTGNNITIKNTKINNVMRTNPKSGIDIEPEHTDSSVPYLTNLLIENVNISNCNQGIDFNNQGRDIDVKINNVNINGVTYGIKSNTFTALTKTIININNINIYNVSYSGIYVNPTDDKTFITYNNINVENCTKTGSTSSSEQNGIRLDTTNGDINNITINNLSVSSSLINFGSAIYINYNQDYKVKKSLIQNIHSNFQYILGNVENSTCNIEYQKDIVSNYYQLTFGNSSQCCNKFVLPKLNSFNSYRKLTKVPSGIYEFYLLDRNSYSFYVDLTDKTVYEEGLSIENKKITCTSKSGYLKIYIDNDNNAHIIEKIGTWTNNA